MLKSINKLYKLNNTTLFFKQEIFINNYYSYYSKKNSNINSNFIKRNSYTHQQDVRKVKRREARSSTDESLEQQLIIAQDSNESNPNTKPSHLHSKPIKHDNKLEQIENHRKKKLERDQKYKEEQRKMLVESLEHDKEVLELQHQKSLENNNNNDEQDNINKQIKKKRQLTQQERLKLLQLGIDQDEDEAIIEGNESSGITEYSSNINNEEELDDDQSSFETDLSSYDTSRVVSNSRGGSIQSGHLTLPELDLTKIDPNNIIDIDEMDQFNNDDDTTLTEELQEMSIEEAHKRFNFTDEELKMLYQQSKERAERDNDGIDIDDDIEAAKYENHEEDQDQDELKSEIEKYERILEEKKEKLREKQDRKQFKKDLKQTQLEIKQSKKDGKEEKKLKKQQERKEKKLRKQEKKNIKASLEVAAIGEDQLLTPDNVISSTQQDLMEKQKVLQHIQELHLKKVKEATGSLIKERDLTPLTIKEVMEFLGNTHLDDFCVIDISNKCDWAQYIVIASSDSVRLLSNTEDDIIHNFKHRFTNLHSNSQNSDEWRVVDLKTVVVHLFETKTREHYDLENLWVTRREKDWKFEESWDDELTGKIEENLEDD